MRLRGAIAATSSALAILVLAATASPAATVTIGSPLTGDFSKAVIAYSGHETVANLVLAEPGALAFSPVEGTVVRWRILQTTGGPFRLRVLAPNPDATFKGVGASGPETSKSTELQTFPTALQIKAGQTIGLDNSNSTEDGDRVAAFQAPAAELALWNPFLAEGASRAPKLFTGEEEGGEPLGAEVAFNADIVPRPGVVLIGPAAGPIQGGTSVAIAGHDFTAASAVKFGASPAASYSVVSDSTITAVSPPGVVGPVDVTVTTVGGTSPQVAADQFAYTACIVPRLTGFKLKADRKKLRISGCALGKVRGKRHKSARVKKQSAKSGTALPPGSPINVKVA
jgi:hypothetical protein